MNKKILFLLTSVVFIFTGCITSAQSAHRKKPPSHLFVKIFKDLEIKICSKNGDKKCVVKKFRSTGSGMIVRLSKGKKIVLTAGHVCNSEDQLAIEKWKKDTKNTYSWSEFITVFDRNRNVHQGHIILDTKISSGNADLCSLYVPTLEYISKFSYITMSGAPPQIGEDILYIGAPYGIYHPPTALIIKGVFSGKIDKISSLISAASAPGASGSVILSKDYKIYGVLFAVHPRFPTATIITSYKETKKFLEVTEKLLQ